MAFPYIHQQTIFFSIHIYPCKWNHFELHAARKGNPPTCHLLVLSGNSISGIESELISNSQTLEISHHRHHFKGQTSYQA